VRTPNPDPLTCPAMVVSFDLLKLWLILMMRRDLDVMEPKQPEDVYKTHLVDGR
jgi:hypothetical protein